MQKLFGLLLESNFKPRYDGLIEEIDVGNNVTIRQGNTNKRLYKVIYNNFEVTDEPQDTEIIGAKNVVEFIKTLTIT